MGFGSGLSAQLGVAAESTVGTEVTVTKFFEFVPETIQWQPTWARGQGLKAGAAFSRATRLVQTRFTVTGDFTVEHADRGGMGLLWRHCIGSTTTTPTQIASTTAYQQVHIPSTSGKLGLGLTVQVGRPQPDGTVRAHTFRGCKVVAWELTCAIDGNMQLKVTLDGWQESTSTALAAASYTAAAGVFSFVDASTFTLGGTPSTGGSPSQITIAGGIAVATIVKGVTITGTTPLATDRYGLGYAGIKAQQIDNGYPTIVVKLDAEYTSRVEIYDLMRNNTTTAMQLDFSHGDAGSSNPFRVSFIAPALKITDGVPNVGGPDIVPQQITAECFDDGTNAPFQVRLVSTDTTL